MLLYVFITSHAGRIDLLNAMTQHKILEIKSSEVRRNNFIFTDC